MNTAVNTPSSRLSPPKRPASLDWNRKLIEIIGFSLLAVSALPAASGTWTNPAGGAWSTAGNWSGGTIADGSGNTAFFNSINLTSNIALTLGGNRTIGNLNFGDTSPSSNSWSLSGDILTLAGGTPTVTVGNLGTGTATISSVVAGTEGLIKNGTGGLILSGNNTYTGATTIRGGQLVLDYANGGRLSSTSLVFGDSSTPTFAGANAGGGIFTFKGGAGSASVNLGSLNISAGQTRIVVDSGTSGADTVSFTTVTRYSNGTMNVDLRSSSGGPNGELRITGATAINTAFAGFAATAGGTAVGYGGLSVTDSVGTGFLKARDLGGDNYSIERYSDYTVSTTISGSAVADDFFTDFDFNNYKIEAQATPLMLTTGTRGFASLLIDTSAASGSLNLGVNLNNNGGNFSGIILSGSHNYEISGSGQLINSSGAIQLSAFGGGTLTVSAPINVQRVGISGNGVVVLSNTGNTVAADPVAGYNFAIFDGGTLSISAASNLGAAGRSVYFDAGTLRATQTGTLALSGPMGTGKNGATFEVTQGSGILSLGGVISQGGPLTKTGIGTLQLSGANTYTGATTIQGGQLVLDNAAGGTLSSSSLVFGSTSTTGFIGANSGGGIFTFKGGPGSASVNLGSLNINAGQTRIVVDSGTLGSDTVRFDSGVTRNSNGAMNVDLRSSSGGPNGALHITGAAGINTAFAGFAATAGGTAVGYGGLSVTDSVGTGFLKARDLGAGTIYSIERYSDYTDPTTISGSEVADSFFTVAANNYKIEAQATPLVLTTGTREFASLLIDTSAASGSLNLGVNLNNNGGNLSGIILSGSHNYEISGSSQLINLGGALQLSAFGGGTLTVSAPINVQRVGISGNGVVVLSNTGNTVNGVPTAAYNFAIFDGGTLSIFDAENLGDAGSSVYFDAGTLRTTQSGLLTLTGPMGTGKNGATFEVTQGTGILSLGGIISQNGPLTKTGAGTLTLTGANTYTGGTTVNAGTLVLGASDRLANTGTVAVNGGTLNLGGFSDTVGAVTLSSGTIMNGTLTGTSYSATNTGTVSAVLAGSGVAFTKTGAGTVTFSAANTYTGNTIVSAGTLVINGSLDEASAVQVGASGTLGGRGSVGAISGAGLVAPGNSPGILTALSVDGASGLDFSFEITALTPTYGSPSASLNDVLRLTDATPFLTALDADNTVTVDFSTLSLGVGQSYTGGFYADSGNFSGSISGANFVFVGADGFTIAVSTVQQTATFFGGGPITGYVTQFDVLAIPEPSTTLLLTGALTALVIFRRRRLRN